MSPTPDPNWDHDAACKGVGQWFWPAENEHDQDRLMREAKAKALCARCPVIIACSLTYSDDVGMRDAIIAGRTGRERKPPPARRTPPVPLDPRPELRIVAASLEDGMLRAYQQGEADAIEAARR